MADRIPVPAIPGAILPHVNTDIEILSVGVDSTFTFAVLAVTVAPTDAGGATFEIRDLPGGLGNVETVTIAQGAFGGSWTGTMAVTAPASLYLRPTDAGGSATLGLTGFIQLGQDSQFTTLARVKEHGSITVTTHDLLITDVIAGVTQDFQQYMGQKILQQTNTAEVVWGTGTRHICLKEAPIQSISSITVDGTALTSAEYEIHANSGVLLKVLDGYPERWPEGARIVVTYVSGYSAVPPAIRDAATQQARHVFRQSKPGGDRLGDASQSSDTGGSSTYIPGTLLPQVRQTLDRFMLDLV